MTRMNDWQPIETAPKDKRILLFRPCSKWAIVTGKFNDDHFAAKPRPYWEHDLQHITGIKESRQFQPTHWMLPEPPREGK